jgi:hypothetical protein
LGAAVDVFVQPTGTQRMAVRGGGSELLVQIMPCAPPQVGQAPRQPGSQATGTHQRYEVRADGHGAPGEEVRFAALLLPHQLVAQRVRHQVVDVRFVQVVAVRLAVQSPACMCNADCTCV